ncbi:MAG: di-trans,poly-cis-decaprenylcistransferase [Candidatus Aenigmatarchaeota archaeon]|nr:MAG: di-trans,poly-cis-decaprenylcistransferase [Candidatus Aenigmarchaeota archaeon]
MITIKTPQHIAIIPDGNRRCAKRLMKTPWKGHEWGLGKLKSVLEWCKEFGIKIITVYALSLENLKKRPKREIEMLFSLARKEINDIISNEKNPVRKNKARLMFFGNLELLPEDLQKLIKKATEITKNNSEFFINLAIAYGGRQELVSASKEIAEKVMEGYIKPDEINENFFRQNLQTNGFPDPDLIIRTGGEKRLSNFLLFQGAYAELVFIDSYWPELTREEFVKIIQDFGKRERRFGR